jgi:hypothetical protein
MALGVIAPGNEIARSCSVRLLDDRLARYRVPSNEATMAPFSILSGKRELRFTGQRCFPDPHGVFVGPLILSAANRLIKLRASSLHSKASQGDRRSQT